MTEEDTIAERKASRARLTKLTALAALVVAAPVVSEYYKHRDPWVTAVAHVVFVAGITGEGLFFVNLMRQQKELERENFLLAATVAFFVTMASVIGLGALYEFHVLVRINPWTFYGAGWVAWIVVWCFLFWRRT